MMDAYLCVGDRGVSSVVSWQELGNRKNPGLDVAAPSYSVAKLVYPDLAIGNVGICEGSFKCVTDILRCL